MAYSVREERQSLATSLRDKLAEAERLILQLRRDNAESFLQLLDSIDECFLQLESSGLDLRPEQARWVSLQSKLRSEAGRVVRVLVSAGGLQQLRKTNFPAHGMWWRLDEVVAANRRDLARRLGMATGTITMFLTIVWAIFAFVIPVDANTVISSEALTSVRQLTFEERWSDALVIIEEAKFQLTQPDAELLIWEAVVRDKLGQDEIVRDTLAAAKALVESDQQMAYWWTLGSAYLAVGDLKKARTIGNEALALYPLDPQGYFLLGTVAEVEGDTSAALDLFEKTFELAFDNNPQLAVIARVRMGTLLQRPASMFPIDENQPVDESRSGSNE